MGRWLLLCLLWTPCLWAGAFEDLKTAWEQRKSWPQGRLGNWQQLVELAREESLAGGDDLTLARALYLHANYQSRVDRDYEASLTTLAEAAALVAPIQDRLALPVQMEIWVEQGSLNQFLARYDHAEFHFRHALEQAGQRQSPRDEARALYRLGRLMYRQDALVAALDHLDEASLRLVAEDDPGLRQSILATKGRIYRKNQDYPQARRYLSEALALAQQHGPASAVPDLLVGLAVTYQKMGQLGRALDENLNAMALYREQGRRLSVAKAQLNMGQLYLEMGSDADKAGRYLDEAIKAFRGSKNPFYLGTALGLRASMLEAEAPQSAIAMLEESVQLLAGRDDISSWQERTHAHERLAKLYEDGGEPALALAHLRQAWQLNEKMAADDINEGRRALNRLQDRVDMADRLRQSEQQRLALAGRSQWWQGLGWAMALLSLLALAAWLWQWQRARRLVAELVVSERQASQHPLSGLANEQGMLPRLVPVMRHFQDQANSHREQDSRPQQALLLLSFYPVFMRELARTRGIAASTAATRRYVRALNQAFPRQQLLAQVADEHFLLALPVASDGSELAGVFEQLAGLTGRFVSDEGLSDGRLAMGMTLHPFIAQRSAGLATGVITELLRFTQAQANLQLEETGQSCWVWLQSLELTPPGQLDGEDGHQAIQEALRKGFLKLRVGH
ncbi:tetratricopeptide repeat protein [Gallaecimonas sp. GXIMD4217]|uniref:tetratricopeptide repeat protein n=1 Tax=Gallaecimonas sp. GXIMD4217 TaxID=3131927 RepID=UPI00311AECFC